MSQKNSIRDKTRDHLFLQQKILETNDIDFDFQECQAVLC